MKKNDWILIISVLVYSFLFYDEKAGSNFLIFNCLLIIAMIVKNKDLIKSKLWILMALGSLLTSVCIFYYGNTLSIIANSISLLMLSAYSLYSYQSIFLAFIFSVYSTLFSFVFMFVDWVKRKAKKSQIEMTKPTRSVLLIVFPILITILFLMLYRNANPIFDELLNRINIDFISFSWILFSFGGFLLCYGFFNHKTISKVYKNDICSSNQLKHQEHNSLNFLGKEITLPDEMFSGKLLFILLNSLLLLVNLIDIKFLFIDQKLPDGISASAFVHQGTNTIIASILFAISIVLFFFRGSLNFYEKSKVLKILTYCWILQNLFLLLSTFTRNNIYVGEFGLTYKRIGVYVYLVLCVIGLLITVVKIAKANSNYFLLRANAWVFYCFLVLACFFNWDNYITKFNISHTKNVQMSYLTNLSHSNLPTLLKYKKDSNLKQSKQTILSSTRVHLNYDWITLQPIDEKLYLFLKDKNSRTWKSNYLFQKKIYSSVINYFSNDDSLSISLSGIGFSNLENLPELKHLKSLNISFNFLNDLKSIVQFKELETLNISNCNLVSIEEIRQLSYLQNLNLAENNISDYTPLLSLPSLKNVIVSKNISKNDFELLKSKMPQTIIELE